MTVSITSNFLANSRGFILQDTASITWTIDKTTNKITATGSGAAGVSPVAGFGTPTGNTVVNNFSGTAATTADMQHTIAEILTIMKAKGWITT